MLRWAYATQYSMLGIIAIHELAILINQYKGRQRVLKNARKSDEGCELNNEKLGLLGNIYFAKVVHAHWESNSSRYFWQFKQEQT